MENPILEQETRVLSFIDIGTNSIRMVLVDVQKNHHYSILREEKEVVRLGKHVFTNKRFNNQDMNRAILVCKKFTDLADAFHADEIIAVATCATRESKNQTEFLNRLAQEADLNVHVISGTEEARLIYLGLSSGFFIEKQKTIFIDIGGGSTEIAIGDQYHYENLETLGLGAIRLTTKFLKNGGKKTVSSDVYAKMKHYTKNKMFRAIERMDLDNIQQVIGSSGTIMNLAEIARKHFNKTQSKQDLILRRKDLRKVIEKLCETPLPKRKKISGINADRADIIIGGAVILETLMEELDIKEMQVSKRGLRHGMIIDYLQRHKHIPYPDEVSVREQSVIRLARTCQVNETHAKNVMKIALDLFDSSKTIGLHSLVETDRELLGYAALLHDIGTFISFRNHHHHSYYIIINAELLGFNQKEMHIIAGTARYHRKRLPKKKDAEIKDLDKSTRKKIIVLSMLLRIAEKLNRSHTGSIRMVQFTKRKNGDSILSIQANDKAELEKWGVESTASYFKKVFASNLIIDFTIQSKKEPIIQTA